MLYYAPMHAVTYESPRFPNPIKIRKKKKLDRPETNRTNEGAKPNLTGAACYYVSQIIKNGILSNRYTQSTIYIHQIWQRITSYRPCERGRRGMARLSVFGGYAQWSRFLRYSIFAVYYAKTPFHLHSLSLALFYTEKTSHIVIIIINRNAPQDIIILNVHINVKVKITSTITIIILLRYIFACFSLIVSIYFCQQILILKCTHTIICTCQMKYNIYRGSYLSYFHAI